MQNLFRRPSGVWVARLAVPERLRQAVGRREFIKSTGTGDLVIAKLIASALIAGWRRTLINAHRAAGRIQMDLEDENLLRIIEGSPALLGVPHIPLVEAARVTGIGVTELLRQVAVGNLRLYARLGGSVGHLLAYSDLPVDDVEIGSRVVPGPKDMPDHATRQQFSGVLALLDDDAVHASSGWLTDPNAELVFHLLESGKPGLVFIQDDAAALSLAAVEVAAAQVERLRAFKAGGIGPLAVAGARSRVEARAAPVNSLAGPRSASKPLRSSIEPYLRDGERPRGEEQIGRIRRACEIFLALMGPELTGSELSADLLRAFRDEALLTFPEDEAKLRNKHKTGSFEESVAKAREVGWPRMSAPQRVKNFRWVCGWVEWLGQSEWATKGIADGLARRGGAVAQVNKAKQLQSKADRRDKFTADELKAIFAADWFRDGRGQLSKAGTYHWWSPYQTFVPLIGLLTGARINEICQLGLNDLQQNQHGIWLFTITISEFDDDYEDGEVDGQLTGKKRLKNLNARRAVPIHSTLVRLGLIEYRDALAAAGHSRLFPELKHDQKKGYGKAATRWFSEHLKGLGMPRNGRKVFHSFRHNFATTIQNDLDGRPLAVKQLLGHARGKTVAEDTYRKDMEATSPSSELVRLIEGLHHDFLSALAPLNMAAALQAVHDALRRKNRGHGAAAD